MIIFILYILLLYFLVNVTSTETNLLDIACKRYPYMHLCSAPYFKSQKDENPFSTFSDNNDDKKIISKKEERLITSKEIDEEKESTNSFVEEGSTFKKSSHSRDEIIEYCRRYNMNFAISCTKKINETDIELFNFCNSFISHCEGVDYEEKGPDKHSHRNVITDGEKELNEFKHFTDEMHKKNKKKLRPCTIDCDIRIYKHCTNECKCDYEYPSVQKFCNPPPMPLFLETCRLWYNRCPKFAQYHYSSQFIYSKASKGKTLPGSTHLASESQGFQGQT